MKTRKDSASILVKAVLVIGLFASSGFSQTVQPGNPTSPGLPPKYPAEGSVDTPLSKVTVPTVPSGWTTKEDGNGCQWSVPGGWYFVQHKVDSLRYGAGKGQASLRGAGFTGEWDAYKKLQKQQFHATQILVDSADRLWLAYSKHDGGLHYFVATLSTLFVCSAHIDVASKADLKTLSPVAKQMAMSVRPTVQ